MLKKPQVSEIDFSEKKDDDVPLENIDNLKISNESLDLKFIDIKSMNFSTIVKPAIRPIKDFINTVLK